MPERVKEVDSSARTCPRGCCVAATSTDGCPGRLSRNLTLRTWGELGCGPSDSVELYIPLGACVLFPVELSDGWTSYYTGGCDEMGNGIVRASKVLEPSCRQPAWSMLRDAPCPDAHVCCWPLPCAAPLAFGGGVFGGERGVELRHQQ